MKNKIDLKIIQDYILFKMTLEDFKKYNGFYNYTDKEVKEYLNDRNNWCQMINEYSTKENYINEEHSYDEWNDNYYYPKYVESHLTLLHPKTNNHIDLWKLQKLEKVGIKLPTKIKSKKLFVKNDLSFCHSKEVIYNENDFNCCRFMSDEEIRNYLNNLEDDKWYKPHPNKKVKFYYRPKEIETIKEYFFKK